jgi:hypothetical protein
LLHPFDAAYGTNAAVSETPSMQNTKCTSHSAGSIIDNKTSSGRGYQPCP